MSFWASSDLTIAEKCRRAALVLSGTTLLALCISFWQANDIRLGGPLDRKESQISDLVADILPPPNFIIEPWLEVSLLADQHGSRDAHLARLKELHREYLERKAYWDKQDLPPELVTDLRASQREADAFWDVTNTKYLPALRSGDREVWERYHDDLDVIYQRHRASIDSLVANALKVDQDLADNASTVLIRSLILIAVMAVIILAGIIGGGHFLLNFGLKPLSRTADSLGKGLDVLASGDISHRITDPVPEEYEHLRRSFNATAESFTRLLGSVSESAINVGTASGQILEASSDLSSRTEKHAHSLNETAAAMSDVTGMVRISEENIGKVDAAMQQAHHEADDGRSIVTSAKQAIEAIDESSSAIAQITSVIDGIAFQTNLLALNAGVEAARAGDAGKGFAVVANEVRALAQRSASAAKDIGELVAASAEHVRRGVASVASTETKFNAIVDRVDEINAMLRGIVEMAAKQTVTVGQVNAAIAKMDEMMQQNAAMAQETTAASASLAEQSHELANLVSGYRTGSCDVGKVVTLSAPVKAAAPRRSPRSAPRSQGNAALARSEDDWSEF